MGSGGGSAENPLRRAGSVRNLFPLQPATMSAGPMFLLGGGTRPYRDS